MRLVIAEDSRLLRAAIARVLEDAGVDVVGLAGDADELLRKVRAHRPDVAIVDIRMPPTQLDEGLQAARVIRAELPHVGVLLPSQHVEERHAAELLEHGADGVGYLLKDRVTDVARFIDALHQIAAGAGNHAIARRMSLSQRAIGRHVTTIFDTLGLDRSRHHHRRVLAVPAYLRAA